MGADDELAAVADRLYALPPADFTAARDAAAKAASGDLRTAVRALRRPTASAWLVNRLAREQPDLLDPLLALGPALAQAQASRSGDDLRALGQQRRELVQAVTATAAADATAAVRTEVEQTLEAALADPAAADAVRTGTLVRPLSFAGFGGVDVEGAVAVARPTKPEGAAPKVRGPSAPDRQVARAEARALAAAAALDDAVRACESVTRRLEQVRGAQQEAAAARDTVLEEVDELERRLTEARERLTGAGHRAHDADREADQAVQAAERARTRVAAAQEAAEQARAALDALRRGT